MPWGWDICMQMCTVIALRRNQKQKQNHRQDGRSDHNEHKLHDPKEEPPPDGEYFFGGPQGEGSQNWSFLAGMWMWMWATDDEELASWIAGAIGVRRCHLNFWFNKCSFVKRPGELVSSSPYPSPSWQNSNGPQPRRRPTTNGPKSQIRAKLLLNCLATIIMSRLSCAANY